MRMQTLLKTIITQIREALCIFFMYYDIILSNGRTGSWIELPVHIYFLNVSLKIVTKLLFLCQLNIISTHLVIASPWVVLNLPVSWIPVCPTVMCLIQVGLLCPRWPNDPWADCYADHILVHSAPGLPSASWAGILTDKKIKVKHGLGVGCTVVDWSDAERGVQSTTCSPAQRGTDPAHPPISLMSGFLRGIWSEASKSVFLNSNLSSGLIFITTRGNYLANSLGNKLIKGRKQSCLSCFQK